MSLNDLERSLGVGTGPLYLMLGDEQALVDRAVARIEQHVLPQVGVAAFNHTRIRAADDSGGSCLSTARTLPMMSQRRLVVVLELDQASSGLLEGLAAYAADPVPNTTLVLAGSGLPKVRKGQKDWGARLRNAVKKHGWMGKFARGAVPATRWARDHAEKIGASLGAREAEILVELVGQDLATLEREVEKAALHAEADIITGADLEAVCSLVAEAVIWDLTSAIVRRDADHALATLHRLLEDGEAPHRLLAMIAWQLRQLLQVSAMTRRGASDQAIRAKVRMNARTLAQVKRAVADARPAAAPLLGALAAANSAMNSHRAGDRRILEGFVLSLCTPD